jgi:hypothetical protein
MSNVRDINGLFRETVPTCRIWSWSEPMLTSAHFLNINKLMAIRRCPYCKAIIDEGSEYCSNCGTQLLFPEDEYIEEEIPGEKIIDEDVPEEEIEPTEETKSDREKSSSKRRKKKDKREPDQGMTEEEIAAGMQEMTELDEKDEQDEEKISEDQEKERHEFEEEEVQDFKTEDLEKIVDSEEKEKEEIEKFLRSLKEEREEWEGEVPPTDEFPPWAEKIKEEQPGEQAAVEEQKDEEKEEVDLIERKGDEYPAEETLQPEGQEEDVLEEEKLEDVPEEELEQIEAPIEEEHTESEVSMPDTGMGLPEGLEQESLPFESRPAEVYEEEEKKPPSRLSIWLKSRAFDVLFIAAIWIVTLHIASRMLSTNVFRLISVASLSVLAFYVVLLAVYLFLFFFFLGQTLGDHLFAQEE